MKQKSRNIVEDIPSIKSDFEPEIQRLTETNKKKEASFKNQHEP